MTITDRRNYVLMLIGRWFIVNQIVSLKFGRSTSLVQLRLSLGLYCTYKIDFICRVTFLSSIEDHKI